VAFPTYVGAGTLVETTTTLTVNPNASHASGDYELLVLETSDEAVTLTTAAGFTEHPGSPISTGGGVGLTNTRMTVFERIWNGSDGSPVTNDPGNHVIGTIFSFRKSSGTWATLADARSATVNVGYATSIETTEDTTGSFNGGITTDTNDQLIFGVTTHAKPDVAGGTAELSAITNGALASITERFDDAAASGNGGWIGAFTAQLATAGATGATTYTKATASYKAHLLIGIRDAAPAAGTTVTVDTPGAVTFTGQTVNVPQIIRVTTTQGAVAFAGQTIATSVAVVVPVTPGAIALTGQNVLSRMAMPVTAGAVAFTGQTVTTSVAVVLVATPGAVTWTGQAVAFRITAPVTVGAVTFTGQTVTTRVAVVATVTSGALTLTGQTILIRSTMPVSPGAVTFAGQTVGAGVVVTVPVTPGTLTLAGQNVALRTLLSLVPGDLLLGGQDIDLVVTGGVGPLILTRLGPKSGAVGAGAVLTISHEGAKAGGAPSGTPLTVSHTGAKAGGSASGDVLIVTHEGAETGGAPAGVVLRVSRKGPSP
jgi:hypothetical protein